MENDRELRAELERLNRAGIINDEEYLVLRELVGRKKLSGETKDRFDRLFRKKSIGRSAAPEQFAGVDTLGEEFGQSESGDRTPSALSPDLISAFASVCALQDKLNRFGGFDHRRDLLECPACGLEEDLTFEGKLITCQPEAPGIETGLIFADLGGGLWQCPVCGFSVREN